MATPFWRTGEFFSSEAGNTTKGIYIALGLINLAYAVLCVLYPVLAPACDIEPPEPRPEYTNPDHFKDPCLRVRYVSLGMLNKFECMMYLRMIVSLALGSLIGFERRRADRPAGVRTMALVSLGACVFTTDSAFAFLDGSMAWDAARVSAAVPAGVGFLGAACIWKNDSRGPDGKDRPEVHGLTTATSVWLAAGVGILCGGGLFPIAVYAAAASVVYLRFAPRQDGGDGDADDDDDDGDGDGDGDGDVTLESLGGPSPETLQALAAMGISPKRGSAAGKASLGGGSDVTSPSSRTTPRPRRPTEMTIQA